MSNPYITYSFNLVMYHELTKAIEQLDLFNITKDRILKPTPYKVLVRD